jgi:hypothetical protein
MARRLIKFICFFSLGCNYVDLYAQFSFGNSEVILFAEENHYFARQIEYKKTYFSNVLASSANLICFENISFIETMMNFNGINLRAPRYYNSLFIPSNKSRVFGIDIMYDKFEKESLKIFLEGLRKGPDSIQVIKIEEFLLNEESKILTPLSVFNLANQQVNDTSKQILVNLYFNILNNSKNYSHKQKMMFRDSIMYLNFKWVKARLRQTQILFLSASNFHLCQHNRSYVNLANRIAKDNLKTYTILMLSNITLSKIHKVNMRMSMENYLYFRYNDPINFIIPSKALKKYKSRLISPYSKYVNLSGVDLIVFFKNDVYMFNHKFE